MKVINERTIKAVSKLMLNSSDMDMDVYLHIVELVIEDEKYNNHVTTFNENDVHYRQWEENLKNNFESKMWKERKTNGVDETMPVTCLKDTITYTDSVPRETYLTKEE